MISTAVLAAVARAFDLCVIECLPVEAPFEVGRGNVDDNGPVPGPPARHSFLRVMTPAPGWLPSVFQEMTDDSRTALRGAVPFLEHFLQQAEGVWHEGHGGATASEPFVTSVEGSEILLRALAITQHEHKLLILQRLSGAADVRPTLQLAREQMLEQENLVRQVGALHGPAHAIDRDLKTLAATGVASEHEDLLRRLGQSSAALLAALAPLPASPSRHRRQVRTK